MNKTKPDTLTTGTIKSTSKGTIERLLQETIHFNL